MNIHPETFARVADFVLAARPDIPDSARRMAATLLLDTIGVAAGATVMDAGKIVRDCACALYGALPAQGAPMMFDGRMVSPAGAAFAGASMIDNLDAHDGYNPVKGHIGCATVPALFAYAPALSGLSGRAALDALVISYEIAARAGLALHRTVSDYHTSGAWNALGVAAMGVRLQGGNSGVLRQALGIAEYHGPRSQMMREIEFPSMLHDGSGAGALAGVTAVTLARAGFTGAPAISVEASDVADIWADLGHVWTIEQNYIKPYPICRWAHGALDGLRSLQQAHGFGAQDVEHMAVETFAESACLYAGMPDTTSQAQYSLHFALATMLRHGEVCTEHVIGAALQDRQTAALIECITVAEAPRHSARFPDGRWSSVVVTLRSGERLESGDVNARGGPEAPMLEVEIKAKFEQFCRPVLDPARVALIWETGRVLAGGGAKFAPLSDLVCSAAGRTEALQ